MKKIAIVFLILVIGALVFSLNRKNISVAPVVSNDGFLGEKGKTVEIKPKIIVSVTYQEIQKSPNYKSGFALRFPRMKALRPDRGLKDIASLEEIKQESVKQQK